MRGKVGGKDESSQDLRITPAYAGKRYQSFLILYGGRDHPRVCGEKTIQPPPAAGAMGSPPRMRGKVKTTSTETGERRITPAYAGKSYFFLSFRPVFQDHPRVCGEKAATLRAV